MLAALGEQIHTVGGRRGLPPSHTPSMDLGLDSSLSLASSPSTIAAHSALRVATRGLSFTGLPRRLAAAPPHPPCSRRRRPRAPSILWRWKGPASTPRPVRRVA